VERRAHSAWHVCVPPAPMGTPAPTPMITLVILVGVGTAVDGVVELLEPPGARAVLLRDAAARGHLPVEGLGELLGEHFCFLRRLFKNAGTKDRTFFLFVFENWSPDRYTDCYGSYFVFHPS